MAFGSMNGGESSDMADINVTPLVDVMLVLMIVFMISMPVFTSAIKVQLPKSTSQTQLPNKSDVLRITVNADWQYFIQDQPYDENSIRARLEEIAQSKEKDRIVIAIHADKTAQYDYVAKLLGAARSAGLSKIGFITELKTKND